MKPINDFHEDVFVLNGSGDHVDSLGVLPLRYEYLDGETALVSCWRVSFRDLLRMIWTRQLWVVVMGERFPPLFVESDKKYTGVDQYTEMMKQQEAEPVR